MGKGIKGSYEFGEGVNGDEGNDSVDGFVGALGANLVEFASPFGVCLFDGQVSKGTVPEKGRQDMLGSGPIEGGSPDDEGADDVQHDMALVSRIVSMLATILDDG